MACFQTRKDFDMSNRLPLGMAEATRLTQAGDLMGATALIQRLLQGGDVPEPAHTGSGSPPSSTWSRSFSTTPTRSPRPLSHSRLPLSRRADSPASSTPSRRPALPKPLRDLAAKHMPAGLDIGRAERRARRPDGMPCAPFPSLCPKALTS